MSKRVDKRTLEWIGVPEAADRLGCTQTWVLKLIARGDLEAFRLSAKAWAISAAAVEKNLRDYLARDATAAGRKRSRM